jgi:hypothetical protein
MMVGCLFVTCADSVERSRPIRCALGASDPAVAMASSQTWIPLLLVLSGYSEPLVCSSWIGMKKRSAIGRCFVMGFTPQPAILPDMPAADDQLDFALYARALIDIILDPNIQTPLTVGIFGSRGSGKTSLMNMIRLGLKRLVRTENVRAGLTVWFNAWIYSQDESIQRSLILCILTELRRELGGDREARQALDKIETDLHPIAESGSLGELIIDLQALISGSGKPGELRVPLEAGLELIGQIAQIGAEADREMVSETIASTLEREVNRLRVTLARRGTGSLETFRIEFRELMERYVLPRGHLVVFVDGLARCMPDKALEVLEALQLFLDVPGVIFVIDIDPEVIERGVRKKYQDFESMEGEGLSPFDGTKYLEEIVQIPFVMPPISAEARASFIAHLTPGLPDPRCGFVFALGLQLNPDRIKLALNAFSFVWRLSQYRPEISELVKPVRLAKLVVIQQQHPIIYDLLRQEPEQMAAWERILRRIEDPEGFEGWKGVQEESVLRDEQLPQAMVRYEHLSSLTLLLLMHPFDEVDANFIDSSPEELRTYVHLCSRTYWRGSND